VNPPGKQSLDIAPSSLRRKGRAESAFSRRMRVVAGSAGGLPLFSPKTDLRPTMDRVKGAIFSSLGDKVTGARVLDLFAGTGALGIEALSRGSAAATFVEKDATAVETIRRNLETTHLRGTIENLDVFRFLDRAAPDAAYDLIFADPPYQKQAGERDFTPDLIGSASLRGALAPDGLFILEKMPRAPLPESQGWEAIRTKRYGATEVVFLRLCSREP
jgi:16S rRNA (guanine966-N2)-methyltransferase